MLIHRMQTTRRMLTLLMPVSMVFDTAAIAGSSETDDFASDDQY
jgi:hypothetical protein